MRDGLRAAETQVNDMIDGGASVSVCWPLSLPLPSTPRSLPTCPALSVVSSDIEIVVSSSPSTRLPLLSLVPAWKIEDGEFGGRKRLL